MKALGQMPGTSLVQLEPVLWSLETQAWLSFFAKERTGALDGLESNVHWAESFPSKIPHPKSVSSHPPTQMASGQDLGPLCTLVGRVDAICGQENKIIINE